MITTFYSFKGGVGRSFALVETAAQLARRGHSVLVWDLDLEAPGLQRIPALQALEEKLGGGTLDLLDLFQKRDFDFEPVAKDLPDLIVDLEHADIAEAGGRLSFLLPGVLDDGYPKRFAGVEWHKLFAPEIGPGSAFFSRLAQRLTGELGYEHLLIDARTGYTDLGAVCAFELPDLLVLVFTLNAQNLAGIEPVWTAAVQRPSRHSGDYNGGKVPVLGVVNLVPRDRAGRRSELSRERLEDLKQRGLEPRVQLRLRPEHLVDDAVPSLTGRDDEAAEWRPIALEIEARAAEIARIGEREREERRQRQFPERGPSDDGLRREVFERAKRFEEKVADLFRLLGYDVTLDYKRDDMQLDVRLEMPAAAIASYALVECKDTARPVTQADVRELASKVEYVRGVDQYPYQAILVARSAFANNAHAVARTLLVQLRTYDELLRSLADLPACIEAGLRGFQGSALERLYVEQDVLLDEELEAPQRRALVKSVDNWLTQPGQGFLALLGDFGTGKTSFARRYAAGLAALAKDSPAERRVPILIDLREARSTTVSLDNILTHRFQSLSPRPFNPQALLHLNREGHLVLIFDGFDEMLGYSDPGQYAENLRQILRAAEGRAKVILTCRTHYFRDRPEALKSLTKQPAVVSTIGATQLWEELQGRAGTRVFYLCDFSDAQIEDFLQRALPPPADWRQFREAIRRTYNLEDLATRPFLLDLIVKTLPRLQAREGTVTIADLYEAYCEEWFRHTDFRLTLVREHKVALVEYLARLVWESPDTRVHYEVLAGKAQEFFGERPRTPFEKEKIDYEVRTALFLNRDARGYYTFIHRSFLEFFVARTLRAGLATGDPDALDLKRLTREVAFFLEFWDESGHIPERCGAVLYASYRRRVSENALLLLYWHASGRLGQLAGAPEALDPSALGAAIQQHWRAWSIDPGRFRLEGAELAGAQVPGIRFDGAALAGADLSRAGLRAASLRGAQLSKARLAFAEARGALFDTAHLREADLNHLDARAAVFSGADLSGADLSFAALVGADLRDARLGGARLIGAGLLRAQGALPAVVLDAFAGRPTTGEADLDLVIQRGHAGDVRCVAWSPDARVVASASDDQTLKLWDAADGRLLRTLAGHKHGISSVAWDSRGERLASGSSQTVKLWDAPGGTLLRTLPGHEDWVWSVAWDARGERLASGSGQTVKLWDATGGTLLRTLTGHKDRVWSVAWDPRGERVASGSDDRTVTLWDAASGALLRTLAGHESWVRSVAWDTRGERLASGSRDRTIKLWDAASSALLRTLAGHKGAVGSVAWNGSGERLASGSQDRTVRLWDVASGTMLRTLVGHEGRVRSVAWDAGGERLASGSDDHTVKLWDAANGVLLRTLVGHEGWVSSVAWDARGERLASGSGQTVKLWDAAGGTLLRTLAGHESWVRSVAWDTRGERLASGSTDQTLKLWDAADGRLLRTLAGHKHGISSVAWDTRGERLASGSDDHTVKLWDAASGVLLRTLGHEDKVRSVAWDARGERLASGSARTVKLWDAASGMLLWTLGHESWVRSVAWDTRGERLASGSQDRTIKLWDPASGTLLHTLAGHEGSLTSVAWDSHGERLASGSLDQTVKLWDAASGTLLRTLTGHEGWVMSVAWDPRGERLAVGCSDGSLWLWDVAADPPCPLVCLYAAPEAGVLAVTPEGLVAASDPRALDLVRFADRWALYDAADVPSRVIAFEKIAEYLRRPATSRPKRSSPRRKRE